MTFFTRKNSPTKATFDELGPLCSIHRLEVGPAEELSPHAAGLYLDEITTAFDEILEPVASEVTAIHSHYWIAGEVVRRFCVKHPTRHVHSVLSLGRLNREKGEPVTGVSALREECEVRVFNAADALLTVCPSEREDVRRLYPEVELSRTYIIPYGVDPNVFYPRPQSEGDFVRRKALGFTKGAEPVL